MVAISILIILKSLLLIVPSIDSSVARVAMSPLAVNHSLADTSGAVDEPIKDAQERDECQHGDKHIFKALLLVVQEVVCPLSGKEMADVGIEKVCDSECCQAEDVAV